MRNNILILLCVILLLSSCEGNCPDKTLEKAEWITIYKKVKRDTIVSYRILEYETSFISKTELKYKVTIANTNGTYSNKFYIDFYQNIVDHLNKNKWKKTSTDTITIKPNKSYTFEYTSSQASKFSNFENAFYIHQIPKNYEFYVKSDSLVFKEVKLNSCETNIEAFIEEQNAIKRLYKEKSIKNSDNILKSNWNNGLKLNNLAWKIYETSDDAVELKNAISYVERALEIGRHYYNLDTYSALLFKTGDYKKANQIGKEAIRVAKKNGIDYDDTTKLMRKYNAKR